MQTVHGLSSKTKKFIFKPISFFGSQSFFAVLKAFNKEKLIRLAQFYTSDFSTVQISFLDNQLETYIHDMQSIEEFSTLKGIGQLA